MWLILEDKSGGAVSATPLPEGQFFIGRGAKCNLVLQGLRISRKHVKITRKGEDVSFEDLGSTLGVALNGAQAMSGQLNPGDRLTIVNHNLRYEQNLPDVLEGASTSDFIDDEEGADAAFEWRPFNAFIEKLGSTTSSRDLLEQLLHGIIDLFSAQRGFVLLKDRNKSKLVPVATASIDDAEAFVSVSSTVYNKALKEGQAVFIRNSLDDKLCQGVQSLAPEDGPRSIVCGPLSSMGKVFGVIYVDVPQNRAKIGRSHIEFFKTITGLASHLLSGNETRKRLIEARGRIRTMAALLPQEDDFVLGKSDASEQLRQLITSAAPLDVSVLITGDTGTGKEMVARQVHSNSSVSEGPFVPVNCGALPRDIVEAELFGAEKGAYTGATERRIGRFELANSGTLFLDEIGEMPLEVQTALLRVLQERKLTRLGGTEEVPVSFRLVCATNVDLEQAVREGTFRQDLYYRINVFRIGLQPLRERSDDILPLARHFLAYYNHRYGRKVTDFDSDAQHLMKTYDWPGNIRELKNAVERAVVVEQSPLVTQQNLPIFQGSGLPMNMSEEEAINGLLEILPRAYAEARELFERAFLKRCLEEAKGNIAAAARGAGMSRCAIYRRLTALGLVEKDEK